MLVVSHFTVADADADAFLADARAALAALAARPGFRAGRVGRAADDPTAWVLSTEWDGVGPYRRALGDFTVKVDAAPLLARARDEPSAFEVLVAHDGGGDSVVSATDRAADAATAAPDRDMRSNPADHAR